MGEGFLLDMNGIGNTLLCNVKYTEVWENQIHKKNIGNITVLTVGHEFNRESVAKVRNKRTIECHNILDTSPSKKKTQHVSKNMLTYEKLLNDLCDGYGRG